MNLTYCGDTHKCRRPNNEDAFDMQQVTENLAVFVVADGLGGHAAGEVASRLAVAALVDTVRTHTLAHASWSLAESKEILKKGFLAAARAIADDCSLHPEHIGMATTLLAALINDTLDCVVANAGDSRAYLGGTGLIQITKDHSFVQELFDRGLITREELRLHPDKNIVTRIVSAIPVDPDILDLSLGKNTLLLCTDGLTDALTDEEIFRGIQDPDLPQVCKTLIDRSRAVNRDNTTVIVVRASTG
jgi:PPM family protein phosphatase